MSNTSNEHEKKPWGGRFSAPTDALVERYTSSIAFDRRLYAQDIRGSIAHARMLARVQVLTDEEAERIVAGLKQIKGEIEAGEFAYRDALEDIHMHIESRLVEIVGEVGKKLHTARSRNDQVATDFRLYVRDAIDDLLGKIGTLQEALIDRAEQEADTIMPGFTHLQAAQPVTLGHHLMAYVEMFHRDGMRFKDARKRVNVLPLGSAALAGTSFPIDRMSVAHDLGFDSVTANSLDAVADRDFAIETAAAASILAVHISRFAEELILWATPSFDFVSIGDAFCTGSSIMPQKKNPDVAELARGKTARVFGDLMTLLTLMKSQPLAYNRDNQEDKVPLFDALDTVRATVEIFAAMVSELHFSHAAMRASALKGYATATDLADYLVRKGVPFRDAHEIVGKSVAFAIAQEKPLEALDLADLRAFSEVIEEDVWHVLAVEGSVAARDHVGGTAPARVRRAVAEARQRLQDWGV